MEGDALDYLIFLHPTKPPSLKDIVPSWITELTCQGV